ncbi:MAG: type II toxin-antitoxin system RelE/ParE family toxin [Patescibacteria group bacterium]
MDVDFYSSDIDELLLSLDKASLRKVRGLLVALNRFGNQLGLPQSKALGDGLFELRTLGKINIRLLYTFHNGKAVILHGLIKKTDRLGYADIIIAKGRKFHLDKI